jgi:hypothetical protein
MSQANNSWVTIILSALGIVAVGLALRLYIFVWRLWIALSFLWVSFWLIYIIFVPPQHIGMTIALAFVPPLLLLVVIGLLAWVVAGLFANS